MNGSFIFFVGRFGRGAVLLNLFNGLQSTVVGAFRSGFRAAEEFDGVVASGLFESEGEAAVFVYRFVIAGNFGFEGGHFEVEE